MTTEQREAIERLTNGEKMDFVTLVRTVKKEGIENFVVVRKEYLGTILSLIKQLESEKEIHVKLEQQYKKEYLDMSELNQKLRKQIDLMAEYIDGDDTSLANYLYRKNGKCNKECIKQYFAGLAEKE